MKDYYLIANPIAGNGKVERDRDKIFNLLEKYGIECEAAFTEKPQHEKELVINAIGKGYRKFISLGGDGTLNEIMNGIFNQTEISKTEITVGAIPVGTGNDWCRMFNIPNDYEKAIAIIKKQKIFMHDVGVAEFLLNEKIKKHYFIIMAGVGYDGFVATKMNENRVGTRGGILFYYTGILKYLFKYQPVEMQFSSNEKIISGKILTACIAITKYNGGGMMQAPFAEADDGIFDVTVIADMSKIEMILNMSRLRDGSFIKNRHVQTFKAKKIKITASPFSFIEADGETLGQTPVEFLILQKAVKMIVA